MPLRTARAIRATLTLAVVAALWTPATPAMSAGTGASFGPLAPQNPDTAANGTAMMHGGQCLQ